MLSQAISPFPFHDLVSSSSLRTGKLNNHKFESGIFKIENNKINFLRYQETVKYQLIKNKFNSNHDTSIIICSKNQSKILKHTLEKLKLFQANKKYDILLIDDRSTEDLVSISNEYNVSYLRIDNELDKFNYSMLNNIGACYAKAFGKKTLVFFNNDMWPQNENSLDNIINFHKTTNSFVTGCKLLYPSKNEYEELGKPQHLLEPHLDQIYSTIQHGGIHFAPRESVFSDQNRNYFHKNFAIAPFHSWRFYSADQYFASINQQCFATTGALQIVNLEDFINISGFNMILTMAFQDIDLCLRGIENNLHTYYVGSENMIHAESITNAVEKITQTPEFLSNNIAWDIIWSLKLPLIIGYQK